MVFCRKSGAKSPSARHTETAMSTAASQPFPIEPLATAPDCDIVVPGSKSITNRALVAALLADGRSVLDGFLFSDDTEAMLSVVEALGATVDVDRDALRVTVDGVAGSLRPGPIDLDVRMSGTTSRFATPLAALGVGPYTIDGAPQMRARPMDTVVDALRSLGADVVGESLPLVVGGGLQGGSVTLAADVSSQFASGLLLAAPGLDSGLTMTLAGAVVSKPYLTMTMRVMQAFGAAVSSADLQRFVVPPESNYAATGYSIEPDASAASYFFAAAAVTGGRVRISGLGSSSMQGDVDFVRVLEAMGATVSIGADAVEVHGPGQLQGVDVDMADISDTAQTLAAIAPFANGPTRVTGIGFIRAKETDRIGAVVAELQRMGIDALEEPDGFVISPGVPQPTVVQTYHDHRMAMSFAITGLMAEGISIADPGCVAKTFPAFFETLQNLY